MSWSRDLVPSAAGSRSWAVPCGRTEPFSHGAKCCHYVCGEVTMDCSLASCHAWQLRATLPYAPQRFWGHQSAKYKDVRFVCVSSSLVQSNFLAGTWLLVVFCLCELIWTWKGCSQRKASMQGKLRTCSVDDILHQCKKQNIQSLTENCMHASRVYIFGTEVFSRRQKHSSPPVNIALQGVCAILVRPIVE